METNQTIIGQLKIIDMWLELIARLLCGQKFEINEISKIVNALEQSGFRKHGQGTYFNDVLKKRPRQGTRK